jgi:hypothetical protein
MIAAHPVEIAERNTIRLISTGRLKEPVLLVLSANHGALEELAALESVTNGRLQAQGVGLPELDPRELVFGRPGHSFINAAFTHCRPGGSRFNDERRGAWYSAFDAETAIAEVGYHLARELEAIGRFETSVDYAELYADFLGRFHDLRELAANDDQALNPDPAIGYPAGQALARAIRTEAKLDGILYTSARRQGGICLVAFRPDLVQNVRQGGIWRLEWQGDRQPIVQRMGR